MDLHVDLTPTQRAIAERRRNFRANIAAKAAELADRKIKMQLAAIPVAAVEAPLIQQPSAELVAPDYEVKPSCREWFVIIESGDRLSGGHPTIRKIQLAVCERFEVRLKDLTGPRRTVNVVKPRQIAMYLIKEMTPYSLPQIGRRFGGRDHTTVLHAVNKIGLMVKTDPQFAEFVQSIRLAIEADCNDQ